MEVNFGRSSCSSSVAIRLLTSVVCLSLLIVESECKTRCVWAFGKVVCKKNATKAANVEIKLMDWDGGTIFDPDDEMGLTISEDDGSFKVEGCGSDFGPWNEPDPYIRVYHFCNGGSKVEETETKVNRTFVPERTDFGQIILDKP